MKLAFAYLQRNKEGKINCFHHLATRSILKIEDASIDDNPLNIDCCLFGDRTDDLDRTLEFSYTEIICCSVDSFYVECARTRT